MKRVVWEMGKLKNDQCQGREGENFERKIGKGKFLGGRSAQWI